jgi:hypothetical protein
MLQTCGVIHPSVQPHWAGTVLEGAMHVNMKLCSTIIDVRPFSTKNQILLFTGRYSGYR